MNSTSTEASFWMLDSSTFINGCIIGQVPIFVLIRSPLYFSEYVFRFELGINAREKTRRQAASWVERRKIGVRQLSLADLDRINQLGAPRRIGLGEITSAIIAVRESGGVLCDDWRGRGWLEDRVPVAWWESTEDLLLRAAQLNHISEFDLDQFQEVLESERYKCRYNLRLEHLRRLANR